MSSIIYLRLLRCNLHKTRWAYCRYKSIDISSPLVQRYLNYLVLQTEALISKDQRDWNEIMKLRKLQPISRILTHKMSLKAAFESLDRQINQEEDEDDKVAIKKEAQIYQKRIEELDDQIKMALLEPYLTESEVLIQVDVKEGDNASTFAKELIDMYKWHARYKFWDFHIVSQEEVDSGVKKASLLIKGLGVAQFMKVEDGMHLKITPKIKVMTADGELPIRANMVNVSVLHVPLESEFEISEENLKVETKVAQDPANKDLNSNSVRITHVPSNTSVECNKSKSLRVSSDVALKKLKTILYHSVKESSTSNKEKTKNTQLQDTKPFRTYDVDRDRVMEHRDGQDNQYSLTTFLSGGQQLETLQNRVLRHWHYENLMEDIRKFKKEYPLENV